jgi:hypothetical protein
LSPDTILTTVLETDDPTRTKISQTTKTTTTSSLTTSNIPSSTTITIGNKTHTSTSTKTQTDNGATKSPIIVEKFSLYVIISSLVSILMIVIIIFIIHKCSKKKMIYSNRMETNQVHKNEPVEDDDMIVQQI